MIELIDRLLLKLLSGRFLATLGVIVVYMWAAVNGVLTVEEIKEITLLVLVFYFSKRRTEDNPPKL